MSSKDLKKKKKCALLKLKTEEYSNGMKTKPILNGPVGSQLLLGSFGLCASHSQTWNPKPTGRLI